MAPHSWNRSICCSQAFRRVVPFILVCALVIMAFVAPDRTQIGVVPQAGELPLLTGATSQYPPPQAAEPKPATVEVVAEAKVQTRLLAKPVVAAEPTHLDVKAVGADGAPYGVGMLEMSLAKALELGWYQDQAVELKAADSSIWLPACQKLKIDQQVFPDGPVVNEDRLRIYFLYSEAFPARVELAIAGKLKLSTTIERSNAGAPEHTALLQQWWSALCQQTYQDISPGLAAPTHDLFSTLGLRLGLAAELPTELRVQETSSFEQQFERMLGMLMGFESVRLAMMIDDSQTSVGHDPAMYPLPGALGIASARLPSAAPYTATSIEPIAQLVPDDCFYVRCGSIQNYMWLRQFLTGWGGSLDEIVTNPSFDSNIRGRIETQLGINAAQSMASGLDKFVSDLAVVGTDVFFEEGAGIGILLQATAGHEHDLETAIEKQRSEIATRLGALRYSETLRGNQVSLLQTPDHRMRSFLVRLGSYFLVTNSQELLDAVLKLKNGSGSLADLNEFRHALATSSMAQNSGVTFYLSDPFFRRITSPAFRIELNRRREAARDCRRLAIAFLLARSMGENLTSRQSLIDAHFLPHSFGLRPDGSKVELVDDEAVDSLRGHVGTFIPVIDVAPTKANQNELQAYQRFTERYRREWAAMDPVLASIKSTPDQKGLEQVEIQIHVTPYARSEYAFLTRSLATPTRTIVSLTEHELLGVSASLHANARTYRAHLGVCDDAVPFRVERGELVREGPHATSNLAQQRSFAAVTPPGTEGLQVLAEFMKSIQTREPGMIPQPATGSARVPVRSVNRFEIANGILSPMSAVFKMSELMLTGVFKLSQLGALYEDAEWSIYGSTSELRQSIRQRLVNRNMSQPTQIYLHGGGVDGSDIAEYLNAYSYCASRRQSAASAAWLNLWTVGLHMEPKSLTNSLAQAIHGQLKCPLGGQWRLQESAQWASHWTSTLWEESSLSSVNSVPTGYRFSFLEWLKRVQLKFNLDTTSLNSHVLLHVKQGLDAQAQPLTLQIKARGTTRALSMPTGFDNPKPTANSAPIVSNATPARSTLPRKSALQPQRTLPVSPPSIPIKFGEGVEVARGQGMTNVAYAANGIQAVSVGYDRLAHLWDLQTLSERHVFRGHEKAIWSVAISPDGQSMVTGSEDYTLRLWDINTASESHRVSALGIFSCVRFSADGKLVLATNWDGKVRILRMPDLSLVQDFNYGVPTLDIALAPNQRMFVLGTVTGNVLLCDSQSGRILKTLVGHSARVHSVAFLGRGNSVLSASHDRTLRLWDVRSGLTKAVYQGHTDVVHEVRVLPDENQFVTCSADRTVRLWDLKGQELAAAHLKSDIRGISLSPDGKSCLAAGSDGALTLWQIPLTK